MIQDEQNALNIAVITEKLTNIEEKTDEVKVLVRATNGRVKKLELWKSFLLGGWAVTTIIVPYLIYKQDKYQAEQEVRIQQLIKESITENNLKQFELFNK